MNDRRGLVVVYTGDGKGKTTAAIGLAVRAAGSDLRTSIIQFIKSQEAGEHRALARMAAGQIEILRMGTGYVLSKPPAPEALAAARQALQTARERLAGGRFDIVVLDEIFPALAAGLVSDEEILALIQARPSRVHLVLTGRGATPGMIERADLVTEMRAVKHPYERGLEAQGGMDL